MVQVPVQREVADYNKQRAAFDAAIDFRHSGGGAGVAASFTKWVTQTASRCFSHSKILPVHSSIAAQPEACSASPRWGW